MFFWDATCVYKLFKLAQGAGIVALFIEVFAKEEKGFLKFWCVSIIRNDPLQPILGANIIFVFDLKFSQDEQCFGMIFAMAFIPDETLQKSFGFCRAVDQP